MRIAYFDCFSGISGDMTIGAFLDAGLSLKVLQRELAKLKITGYTLKKSKVMRGAISGTKFDCIQSKARHVCGHTHMPLSRILKVIDKSSLKPRAKAVSKDIFINIGKAEASIHGISHKSDVNLHELGDIDSIVDIVGVAVAIDELGIDEVHASKISLGRTRIRSKHGVLPIPAPATLELLKGAPVKVTGVESELVTPTGAGILRTLSKGYGEMPEVRVTGIGYGAGSRDPGDMPNMLRIVIGEKEEAFNKDKIVVMETNIDDMSPQYFEHLFERLFKAGALDVYTTLIHMKKSRPAFKLTALADPGDIKSIARVIFRETTTIGIRYTEMARLILDRKIINARTKYGMVKVKVSTGPGGISTISPEYEDCLRIARKNNIPIKTVYDTARKSVPVGSIG
jgi:pyridinium-3,5-bisthiocarboxylic acid mononucleotide nickel chelatase